MNPVILTSEFPLLIQFLYSETDDRSYNIYRANLSSNDMFEFEERENILNFVKRSNCKVLVVRG